MWAPAEPPARMMLKHRPGTFVLTYDVIRYRVLP
jgi:hypothetical protein